MKSRLMLATSPKIEEREENDFYATNPKALKIFLEKLKQDKVELSKTIWECACGKGHLAKELRDNGYEVYASDLINRGYGFRQDFLKALDDYSWANDCDILTNPPFNLAEDFVRKGMNFLVNGKKLILFLKIQFLESKARKELFEKYPPKYIYINSERQQCAKDGNFEKYKCCTLCFCWFIWEKGFTGEPVVRWI